MGDSIKAITKDRIRIEWLGPDVMALCSQCHQEFVAPENSNSAIWKVCRDCWYRPAGALLDSGA